MNYLLSCCLLFLLIGACNSQTERQVHIVITNERDTPIRKIRISNKIPSNTIRVSVLQTHHVFQGDLDFKDVPRSDGVYEIGFDDGRHPHNRKEFYYTNGWPHEKEVRLIVRNDSTQMKTTTRGFY